MISAYFRGRTSTTSKIAADLPSRVLECIFSFLTDDCCTMKRGRLVCKKWNETASPYLLAKCKFVGSQEYSFEYYLDEIEKSPARFLIKELTLRCQVLESSEISYRDRVTHIYIDTLRHLRAQLVNLEVVTVNVPINEQDPYSSHFLDRHEGKPVIVKRRPRANRALADRPLKRLTFGTNFLGCLNAHSLGICLEQLPPVEYLAITYVLIGGDPLRREYWQTRHLNVQTLKVINVSGYQKFHCHTEEEFLNYVASLAILIPSPTTLIINFGHSAFVDKFGQNLTVLSLFDLDLNSEHYTKNMLRCCPKLESLNVTCRFGVLYTEKHENIWAQFITEAIKETPSLRRAAIVCSPQKFRALVETKFWLTQLPPLETEGALMAPMKDLARLLDDNQKLAKLEIEFDMAVSEDYSRSEHEKLIEAIRLAVNHATDRYPHAKDVLSVETSYDPDAKEEKNVSTRQ